MDHDPGVEQQLHEDLKHAAEGDWAAVGLDDPEPAVAAPPGFAPASIDDLLNA